MSPGDRLGSALARVFFPVTVVLSAATALLVVRFLNPVVGVRGLYAFLGLVVGGVVYYGYRVSDGSAAVETNGLRWSRKLVYALVVGGVVATTQLDSRLPVLVAVLPVGYLLFALQLRAGTSTRRLLPQAIALFALPPMTKYLSHGFYFAGGDTLFHVHHVERLLATGTAASITGEFIGHGIYRFFPGLHVLVGAVSSMTGLSAYDGLMTTGLVFYAVGVIPIVYVLARAVFDHPRVPLYAAVSATVLYPISYFSTYLFPQSLAVPLLVFVLFVGFRATTPRDSAMTVWTGIGLLVTVSAMFTHHLSFILLAPVLLVVGVFPEVVRLLRARGVDHTVLLRPRVFPLLAGWITAVTYWTVMADQFIINLLFAVQKLVQGLLFAGSSEGGGSFVGLGTEVPTQTVATAVANLAWTNSLYLIAMTAVFALGVVFLFERFASLRRSAAVSVLAMLGALLIFKTPLLFPGLSRVRMPFALFFPLVFGLGLYRLVRSSTAWRGWHVVPVVVFVVLAATAPLYVWPGDDLYGIHDPPNGPPQRQVAFSETEVRTLSEANQFARSYDAPFVTFWATSLATERFGGVTVGQPTVENSTVRAEDGMFLYRQQWTEFAVFSGGQKILMSEPWLRETVYSHSQVYDSGDIGVLWNRQSLVLS